MDLPIHKMNWQVGGRTWPIWVKKPQTGAFLVAQSVKNLLTVQETQVWSLGQEDPLMKEMANHLSIPAWKIPWAEEPGGLQHMESQRVGHNRGTNTNNPDMEGKGQTVTSRANFWEKSTEPLGWARMATNKGRYLFSARSLGNREWTTKTVSLISHEMLEDSLCSAIVKTVFGTVCACSQSVMPDCLRPHGLLPVRLLWPWNSPGKNTGVGWHFFLQWIFPTQGSNPHLLHLLHWQEDSFITEPPGKLRPEG